MWRIPLSDLNYDDREAKAVQNVLKTGWLTMGPRSEQFEEAFASRNKVRHAIAVTNCTCALELAYRYVLQNAAPEKNAIVIPDITFVATANAVIAAGGIPILCDIESPGQPFLSIEKLSHLLASRNNIAGVSIVHYAGIDSNSEQLGSICLDYNIPLIEDCAHAAGASTDSGKVLGSIGLAGCFSFFSNKNLATGEGGMLTTNDDDFAEWTRLVRSHGVTATTWSRHQTNTTNGYDTVLPGYNYRITEITAALGLVQLDKLTAGNRKRHEHTKQYRKQLAGLAGYEVVYPTGPGNNAAYHILPLLCPDETARNRVRAALNSAGIQTSHHYSPIHSFSYYQPHKIDNDFSNATAFTRNQLTLPLHPGLSSGVIEEIVDIIRETANQ